MHEIKGLHHVTAIAGEPQTNINFYTSVLGLRLVKRTVTFDDPTTYHLYYGDGQGHPGTIMTFFPWPGAPRGRVGTRQLTVTSFAAPEKSLPYWREHLSTTLNFKKKHRSSENKRCFSKIQTACNLSAMAGSVTLKRYPSMGHTINHDEILEARKILGAVRLKLRK